MSATRRKFLRFLLAAPIAAPAAVIAAQAKTYVGVDLASADDVVTWSRIRMVSSSEPPKNWPLPQPLLDALWAEFRRRDANDRARYT